MDTNPDPAPDAPTGDAPRPYPVLLLLDGAPCLVVGAGPVAARKARGLLEAGAAVTVVAPTVGREVRALAGDGAPACGSLRIESRAYAPPEAERYLLVVSATGDPEVDARVTADASTAGALVNRADTAAPGGGRDTHGAGTVLLPAVHRTGPVTVAVSTDGSSPALARWLRDRIGAALDSAHVATLAEVVGEARDARATAPGRGGSVDWAAALDDVAPLVAAGRAHEAREVLARHAGATTAATPRPGGHHR